MNLDLDTFIYAGLFLTDSSKDQLEINFCDYIENGASYLQDNKVYLDHCTMIFNDGDFDDAKSENILNYLSSCADNTHFTLTIDGIGRYQSVYAFRVKKTETTNMLIKNKQPHITCVLDPSMNKPVDSNKIVNWMDITPVRIDTVCRIFSKKYKRTAPKKQ